MSNTPPSTQESFANAAHPKTIACVHLRGPIQEDGQLDYFSAEALLSVAFAHPKIDEVMLYINSPGGTPAQSEMIANKIRALATKHNKKIYAVVGDSAASGGYWIAAAADEIYIQKTSTVGSIGVRADIGSHSEKMKQEGIHRKTITSGKNKTGIDPNKPLNEQEDAIKSQEKQLAFIHHEFIKWVRSRREDKLDKTLINEQDVLHSSLFDGSTFIGEEAVKTGLADGIASLDEVKDIKFGHNAVFTHITMQNLQYFLQSMQQMQQQTPANGNAQPAQKQRKAAPKRPGMN